MAWLDAQGITTTAVQRGGICHLVVGHRPWGTNLVLTACPHLTHCSHLCGQVWRDASLVDSVEAGVYFPCRQWFDKERGMSKELFPMIRRTEENVEFRIRVRGWGRAG